MLFADSILNILSQKDLSPWTNEIGNKCTDATQFWSADKKYTHNVPHYTLNHMVLFLDKTRNWRAILSMQYAQEIHIN